MKRTIGLEIEEYDSDNELVIGIDCEGLCRDKPLALIQVRILLS